MQSVQSQLQGTFEAGFGKELNDFQKKTAFAINNYGGKLNQFQHKAGKFAIKNGVQVFPVHVFTRSVLFNFFYHPTQCEPYEELLVENRKRNPIKKFFENYSKK